MDKSDEIVYNRKATSEDKFLVVVTTGFRLHINRNTNVIRVFGKPGENGGGPEDFPLIGEINLNTWHSPLTIEGGVILLREHLGL